MPVSKAIYSSHRLFKQVFKKPVRGCDKPKSFQQSNVQARKKRNCMMCGLGEHIGRKHPNIKHKFNHFAKHVLFQEALLRSPRSAAWRVQEALLGSSILELLPNFELFKQGFSEAQGMTPVAPRIVNDVSYATRINRENHSSWQAQYLVRLVNDTCCSAHCKLTFHM